MNSIVVFDGFQLIAAGVLVACGIFIFFLWFLDRCYQKNRHSRVVKFFAKLLGVKL